LRVLQLAPIWETVPPPAYGGTETVVSCLTEELSRRGIEVTLAASGDSTTSADFLSVFPTSLRPAGLIDCALQYSIIHVAKALRHARDFGFDIVHNHNGPPSELGMALSNLVELPMLTTLHNNFLDESQFIWSHYRGWYNTISRAQAEDASPCLPRAKYAGVVYNAIDVDSFPFQPQKSDFALFIGRMAPEKAPHLAIEASKRAGVRLVLAGKVSIPEERDYFDAMVRPHIDGCHIDFVGEADSRLKRDLYSRARCLLAPIQWNEPFGLVMIEAMACGTPPIATKRGATHELIDDGVTGILVDSVDEMAEAICRSGTIDPFTCRRSVEARFSPGALADSYLRLYENILACEQERGRAIE
jgi:glycosyltransferase involved in cell wall biosynthesis